MHSEPAIENRASRGRRRKRGNGSPEGPVFVDTSGRRARLLRRIGLVLGAVCLGYAAVLGAAFMGWGTSLTPAQLLPFAGAGPGGGPGGPGPGGPTVPAGAGVPTAPPPSGAGTAVPSPRPTASAAASAAAVAG
ncbi:MULTISPECIES: hypothetical protein [unclassified Streptomyces]|jgi:hypothetical protein|uniref:hypothetical protein n=1 Tax=unclassified Streptomyces TaxID=2593676 RepID=UPI003CEAA69C